MKTNIAENRTMKTDEQDSLEDIRLQYECEQACARRHFQEPSVDVEWKKFQSLLEDKVQKHTAVQKPLRMRWIGAALAIAAVFTGIIYFTVWHESEPVETKPLLVLLEETSEQEVRIEEKDEVHHETAEYELTAKPMEKQGAVLSSKQADYSLTKAQPLQLTVSVPRGKIYPIRLNDGTEVWLNAGSRMSFPNRFEGDTRTVMLEGEAYFKVARDEKRPFIVNTDQVSTHVLGTEFNVKAYPGSESHVTLVKGSVKVEIPNTQKEVLLYPGEDIACLENGTCTVKQVDTEEYAQWLAGYFYFDNVHLKDILKELGYWYNLTVELEEDAFLLDMRLHFVVERNIGITQVAEKLNMYRYLSVTKEGNTLRVCRKK